MAALTWRNVEAPDFRSSMEGYKTFSSLMNNAFGGLTSSLDKFDAGVSERVNREAQAKLLSANSPEELQAMLGANGLFSGSNARRFSADTMNFAAGREGVILENDGKVLSNEGQVTTNARSVVGLEADKDKLAENRYTFGRTQKKDAARDGVATIMPKLYAMGFKGDESAARAYLADPANAALLAQLDFEDQGVVQTKVGGLIKENLGRVGDRLTNTGRSISNAGGVIANRTASFNLGKSQQEYAQSNEAQAAIQAIAKGGYDYNSGRQQLESMKLSPAAYNAALGQLGRMFPDAAAGPPGGTKTAKGGSGGTSATIGDVGVFAAGAGNVKERQNITSLATSFAEASEDQRDINAVAGDLVGVGGAFEGEKAGYATEIINRVMQRAKTKGVTLSPATAAAVIKNSTTSDWMTRRSWLPGGAAKTGIDYDNDKIDGNINLIKSGGRDDLVIAGNVLNGAMAQRSMIVERMQAARAGLARAQMAASNGQRVDMAKANKYLAEQEAALEDFDKKAGKNPALNVFYKGQAPSEPTRKIGRSRVGPLG